VKCEASKLSTILFCIRILVMCKHRFCNVSWCIANHFLCSCVCHMDHQSATKYHYYYYNHQITIKNATLNHKTQQNLLMCCTGAGDRGAGQRWADCEILCMHMYAVKTRRTSLQFFVKMQQVRRKLYCGVIWTYVELLHAQTWAFAFP